jgi:hypothetical protein
VIAYGGTYRVDWEAGVLVDAAGTPLAAGGFTFSVRASGPAPAAAAVTVAADGSGDFATVQGAIDWVPAGNAVPRTITVRAGVYEELVYLGSRQPFVTLRGEDRAGTVITYVNNQNFNPGNNRAMVAVDASDVTLANLTLRNTTPRGGSQAEALLATLRPGAFTVALADAGGAEGNGLVEIYDADPGAGTRRLANLSSRALVGEGEATLISGLTVAGTAPKPVLVRGIGPALANFGVEGALARPRLTVYRGPEALAVNTGWTGSVDALEIARAGAVVGAFPLVTGSGDTALLLELAPGNYTAQVSAPAGAGGVALLEVYEVP